MALAADGVNRAEEGVGFRLGQTHSVVRTGARAGALQRLLVQMGFEPAPTMPPVPDLWRLPSDQADWIMELFRLFGGSANTRRLRPGPWDLAFEGGLVVELDEELHFNRYRRLTLDQKWTKPLPWREDYLSYSEQFEVECLRAATWGSR